MLYYYDIGLIITTEKIFGHLDIPTEGEKVNTYTIKVAGWTFSSIDNKLSVEVLIDDNLVYKGGTHLARPDVLNNYQSFKKSITSGFSFNVDVNKLSNSFHSLKVISRSSTQEKIIGQVNLKVGELIPPETPKLSDDDENRLESNLIWIFGTYRSGTTWLAKELLSYKTSVWDEPGIGWHLGMFSKTPGLRSIDKNQARKNYFFNHSYKSSWLFYLRKLILLRIYSEFLETGKKIIIKEPNGSLAADILSESLSKSKFILVVRDCRDVIASLADGMREGGWLAQSNGYHITDEQRPSFIEEEAITIQKTWEVLLNAYRKHDDDLKYCIRYEDLRINTLQELKKLYEFLEIKIELETLKKIVQKYDFKNIPDNQKGQGQSKRSATPALWKKNLTPQEITIIHKILGPTLKSLGYSEN